MPKVGDKVKNTNPKCKHFGSQGIVTKIGDLPKGAGKTISYRTTNGGGSWKSGDTLDKTPDQLDPLKPGKLKKGHKTKRGGNVYALDTMSEMMGDLYSERIGRLKEDLAKAVKDR